MKSRRTTKTMTGRLIAAKRKNRKKSQTNGKAEKHLNQAAARVS